MWVPKKIIYLTVAPICFWGFIAFLIYAFLTFDDTILFGWNFYTSYIEFFPILLLCIVGCGAHITIGLSTFYQKDRQWRYQ
ncbi:MAG: hypothetical protein LN408_04640 [Candidatus Thermoplasmatota archaeon]|nr:hypothetical protein [Candidatus Thermoplasmatota archaeon]